MVQKRTRFLRAVTPALALVAAGMLGAQAKLITSENATHIAMANDRLSVGLIKKSGVISALRLDGTDLLGRGTTYLDCYCIPSGSYTIGSSGNTNSTLVTGTDSTGTAYAGLIVSDVYTPSNQTFQQFWFLRDGETGLHAFSHLAYYNAAQPILRNLQELRTLFRPNTPLWTHLSINEHDWAPLPSAAAVAKQQVAQDATWWLGNTPDDPYFTEWEDYFTKYSFSDSWRNQKAHGLLSDGRSTNGTWFGAWLVMNTQDTYFGGPLHSDLLVDGITYNYISSNHHGDGVPNITHGFDRTFGPQFYHFNTGSSHAELRADAERLASPSWNAAFYDSIAQFVPNYVPSGGRGSFQVVLKGVPKGAKNAIAVLSVSGYDFQDNAVDTKAYQYWGEIDTATGRVVIPRVKAGTYRLTVYADGVFGQYVQDNIVVNGGAEKAVNVDWKEENAGVELWRLGTPDKSAGEYKRGYAPDTTKSRQPAQYRVYWGHYNFTQDFPNGVNFTIGKSKEAEDWNYIQWSVYGPTFKDKTAYVLNNNWTVNFDLTKAQLQSKKTATLTIQLAGVKTASGNTDVLNGEYSNLELKAIFNGQSPLPYVIPWYQSSSCGARSAVSCYNLARKLTFDTKWLKEGRNQLVLQIPYNATNVETAILPASVYVQYDAIRLEVK